MWKWVLFMELYLDFFSFFVTIVFKADRYDIHKGHLFVENGFSFSHLILKKDDTFWYPY